MLPFLLFAIYLFAACWLITKSSFIRRAGLKTGTILTLFLLKISAGIALGWMSKQYYPGNDYWTMNQEGQLEYQLLIDHPGDFFSGIFHSVYAHYNGFFDSVGSYWNDLKNNLIIKSLAICNIFSRGNYYINSLFFNTVAFFALVALYRVFIRLFPGKQLAVILGCFLVPSTLYFTSGIYKDLVIASMLGFYSYALYFGSLERFTYRRIILLLISFLCILLIRNYVAVVLVPFSFAFIASSRFKQPAWMVFAISILFCLLAIWLTPLFSEKLNPLAVIVQKQRDFAALPVASTQIPMQTLEAKPSSFIKAMPQALNHGFLRPYLWETSGRFLWPMAFEILALLVLFVICLFFRNSSALIRQPFLLFGLCTGFVLLLLTGYIIPNLGSIVRYRSIYMPYLLTPLLCLADGWLEKWNKRIIF